MSSSEEKSCPAKNCPVFTKYMEKIKEDKDHGKDAGESNYEGKCPFLQKHPCPHLINLAK